MPTPYDLRSPESIAEEYGGNKQKIGAAVQAGLLDPTAAVLAGMFIDRVRGAAMAEQAAPSTVAQDALAPAAGLGAAMPPSMGAVPPPGAGAVPAGPAMPPPQMPQQMPQGMARGGITSLNVPDTMYDYAGGGIVAFAEGDEVEERLRLRPVDSLADAYVFLQERGAEIPEDMSEEAIINYANRVREMENMEVRDAGARVPSEPTPSQITPFGAPRVDYGRAADPMQAEEVRPDVAPQMPMGGGEFAPGFSPVAPTGPVQRGLMPPKTAPEGPAPERAVPFLGQLMEAITPTAEASGFRDGAPVVTPEAARAELAEIAPDWYDASQRSDAQVVKDLADFKEGTYRTKPELVKSEDAGLGALDVDAETQRRLDMLLKDPEYQNMLMPGLRGVQERYNLADQLEAEGLFKRAEGERAEAEKGLAQLKKLPVYGRLEMISPQARVDEKLRQANDPNMLGITNIYGTSPEDAARLAAEARAEQEQIDTRSGVPFGSFQASDNLDRIKSLFPTMETSVAPSAARDEADYLNKNELAKAVENYSLSPMMPTLSEMGFGAAEIPEIPETPVDATTPPVPGAASNPKLAGLFGDEKAKNMALLELGARLMSGTSPYALQNLGTAATGTIGSLREQEKAASDRLLKERMLQIEEAKVGKEKDTDERNRLRILESGTPEERAALQQLMEQEQAVARGRLGLGSEKQNLEFRKFVEERKMILQYRDPEVIQAFEDAGDDPDKLAAANRLLEQKAIQSATGNYGSLGSGISSVDPSLLEGYGGGSIFTKSGQM